MGSSRAVHALDNRAQLTVLKSTPCDGQQDLTCFLFMLNCILHLISSYLPNNAAGTIVIRLLPTAAAFTYIFSSSCEITYYLSHMTLYILDHVFPKLNLFFQLSMDQMWDHLYSIVLLDLNVYMFLLETCLDTAENNRSGECVLTPRSWSILGRCCTLPWQRTQGTMEWYLATTQLLFLTVLICPYELIDCVSLTPTRLCSSHTDLYYDLYSHGWVDVALWLPPPCLSDDNTTSPLCLHFYYVHSSRQRLYYLVIIALPVKLLPWEVLSIKAGHFWCNQPTFCHSAFGLSIPIIECYIMSLFAVFQPTVYTLGDGALIYMSYSMMECSNPTASLMFNGGCTSYKNEWFDNTCPGNALTGSTDANYTPANLRWASLVIITTTHHAFATRTVSTINYLLNILSGRPCRSPYLNNCLPLYVLVSPLYHNLLVPTVIRR